MDLNYLFFRQQVERSMAASADSDAARKAHETLAGEYESRIGMVAEAGRSDVPEPGRDVNSTLAVAITAREVDTGLGPLNNSRFKAAQRRDMGLHQHRWSAP